MHESSNYVNYFSFCQIVGHALQHKAVPLQAKYTNRSPFLSSFLLGCVSTYAISSTYLRKRNQRLVDEILFPQKLENCHCKSFEPRVWKR